MPTEGPGPLKGPRRPALISLAVALLAAGAFLAGSPPHRVAPTPAAAAPPLPTLAEAWPSAHPAQAPGVLPDGAAFTPLLYLDPNTSIGSAPTPDRAAVRLMLRGAAGQPRELHRVAADQNPQFAGFATAGGPADDTVVWAESTADTAGHAETRIWKVNWRTAGKPTSLTADTGDAIFFNSQYDLVIAGGRVYWAAAARKEQVTTEVRSVALTGGKVAVRDVPGAYSLSAWPWLVSAGSGQAGPVDLVNLDDGRKVHVPAAQTELVTCSPAWCRVLVLSGSGGPARLDLMRSDGSDRRRMAGGQASSSTADVALLDRFEVLSQSGAGSATSSQEVMLYDAARMKIVLVAKAVGMVFARGGIVSWSTGDNESLVWHALDLRTLA
jgi:hypothetical protein